MAKKQVEQGALFPSEAANKGPVTCLGMTFADDQARRDYFTEELRKKLPELKSIEGFPLGEDEDILALSDPPYYTACPNPFIPAFIAEWEREKEEMYGEQQEEYHREPFAADVSEGKNDPLYGLPSYYTKVPPRAILKYILHYTDPGDVILDCFCGSGMTGVAARISNDVARLKDYSYLVKENNEIIEDGKEISILGSRRSILVDLSPYATFISSFINSDIKSRDYEKSKNSLLKFITESITPLYMTDWNGVNLEFDYAVWSDWSVCENCGFMYRLFDHLIDWEASYMVKKINCPGCGVEIRTEGLKKFFETEWDQWINSTTQKAKTSLVLLSRMNGVKSDRKKATEDDIMKSQMISEHNILKIPKELKYTHMTHERNNLPKYWGITHIHQFYTKRNYYALDQIIGFSLRNNNAIALFCALSIIENNATKRNRFYVDNRRPKGSPIGPLSNTLYVPTIQVETNIGKKVKDKLSEIDKIISKWPKGNSVVSTQSATNIVQMPDDCIDFIFTDPPFGGNINYSEQSILTEWWLNLSTNNECEAITNNVQKKENREYQFLMTLCFKEYYRVLKPNHWMVVEFHNSSNQIWNCIQQSLEAAGFVIASVNLLDKKHDTLHQDHKSSAVNKDLAITVYKPRKELESIALDANTIVDSIWKFIDSHLQKLPLFNNNRTVIVSERLKYVLFDRMVAYYLQRGIAVPISAADFYKELQIRYIERDGMYFLQEQSYQYDKNRLMFEEPQLRLFISDERSAIEWLRNNLKRKPQTYQDIHPDFFREISGWNKYDEALELADLLLEQNFLRYEGSGPVPSQIHAYLSTNFKDMRELDKEDPALRKKAKDRWYVPDPNKQADLDKLREKSLLREFEAYVEEINRSKKKLKQFRLEAIRAGFKKAWGEKNYRTIVDIGSKLPEAVLQEDDKLLMYFDNAQMRLDG